MTSEAWADLGGGIRTVEKGMQSPHTHEHTYAPSGWCTCGTRDDGQLAEWSPAWLAARDRKGHG